MAAHPSKLQSYTQMAADNSTVITSSFDNWSAFLVTASKMYKYTFLEQLIIHIQRPQATACAEYGTWSKEMHRYVRRYAKGIAVISFIDGQPTLRHVFDVADTGPKEGALYPFLWTNRDEYQSVITAALENRFNVLLDQRGLPIQLANIAAQLAGKYWTNGEEKIIASIGDRPSNLTRETFQDAAVASVTYSLLSRCGLHPEQFFDAEDFTSVYKFNSFRPVLALGTAVSRCNEVVLRCIEMAVKQYERDKRAGKLNPAPAPSPAPAAPPAPAPEVVSAPVRLCSFSPNG